jgi:hypothetical protein
MQTLLQTVWIDFKECLNYEVKSVKLVFDNCPIESGQHRSLFELANFSWPIIAGFVLSDYR